MSWRGTQDDPGDMNERPRSWTAPLSQNGDLVRKDQTLKINVHWFSISAFADDN